MEEIHILISGKVQGVGFRYATLEMAQGLGLHGWVRNNPTGEVEILAQGESEQISDFFKWCQHGPALASVKVVNVVKRIPISSFTYEEFDIHR